MLLHSTPTRVYRPAPNLPPTITDNILFFFSRMNAQACVRCRTSKRRCDKAYPICSRCQRAGFHCAYDDEVTSNSGGTRDQHASPAHSILFPGEKGTKKRCRVTLSCTRCHRLKVKCDKAQPCERCRRSGYTTSCAFTNSEPRSSSVQTLSTPSLASFEEDPEVVVATWFLRKSGSSQYKAILDRVSNID